jgi:hypothetical protein
MGARAWVRQTANEPVRNLIRLLEKVSGAERTLTIRPYHGDKSGESLASNSVHMQNTRREAERLSRELRLGTLRQERNRHFDLQASRNRLPLVRLLRFFPSKWQRLKRFYADPRTSAQWRLRR